MNRTLLNVQRGDVITFAERPGVEFKLTEKEVGRGASCIVYHAVGSDHTEHLLKEYYPKHLDLSRDSSGQIVVPEDKAEAYAQGLVRFREGCEKQKSIRLSNEGLKNFTCNVQGYYQANGTEYIDMTCFNGHTYDHVREKSVYELILRMRTLAQVVGNYHKAGLLHLDIKPENIYVRPEGETIEDVMLFDFDSVTPMDELCNTKALSCTKTWAAPEQLLPEKRRSIYPATDLFAIGEIIFVQLFDRHSTSAERRSFVTKYDYDHKAPIFKDMNPKVFPLLDDLLLHTICGVVGKRYQSAEELIAKLDEIIKIANPETPYLKSSLPAVQDFFVGRENEINEIHRLLNEKNILFLNGIGGIGKSELAKHYAMEHKGDYDAIIFAPYVSDVDMLLQDDNAVPLYNFTPYPEEKPEEYCARKLKKLRELCDERTLFIVDNMDCEDDSDISKLLGLECKLLITTRMDFSDYGYGQQLYLDALCNRYSIREIFDKYYTKPISEEENACVEQIIDLVAGHTMTVELLAKQMMAGRVTPEKMLTRLQERGIGESGKEKVRSGKDGTLSAQSTYAHIQALFDLSELDEDDQYILTNLSLIPHTGISTELFHDWCELEDYGCINQLVVEGWVRQDKNRDYISLHPVVADIVGDIFHKKQDCGLLSNFSEFISNESDDYNLHVFGQQTQSLIFSLVHKFAERFLKLDEESPCILDVLYKIGGVFFDYGDYANCEKVWVKASAGYSHQGNDKDVAEIQCSLALLYAEKGRLEQDENMILRAIESYQQSISTYEKLSDWASLATIYNNIGSAYHDLKQYETAVSMYQHSIECHSYQTEKGSRYVSSVAICHNNIGVLFKDMQQYHQAIKSYRTALALLETQPWNTIDNALIRHNLAVVLYKKDSDTYDLCQAKTCVQEALSIRQKVFPSGNISIAQSEELFARILMEFDTENANAQAEELLISAQKPFFDYYGKDNEESIRLLKCLTAVQAKRHRNE